MGPGSEQHVPDAFHLATVLRELLVDVDQDSALASSGRIGLVLGCGDSSGRRERIQFGDVSPQLDLGAPGAIAGSSAMALGPMAWTLWLLS